MPSPLSAVMVRKMTGMVDWLQDDENSRSIVCIVLSETLSVDRTPLSILSTEVAMIADERVQ